MSVKTGRFVADVSATLSWIWTWRRRQKTLAWQKKSNTLQIKCLAVVQVRQKVQPQKKHPKKKEKNNHKGAVVCMLEDYEEKKTNERS